MVDREHVTEHQMYGMMQDRPLTISMLWRRLEKQFGHKRVITGLVDGESELTWSEVSVRARKLASALEYLDVPTGACVATFAWNSHRHVELYLAVPGTGRILHTVNHRSFRDQITYMVNSASDDVVFVDRSLLPTVWPMADTFTTVRHFVVMDDGADTPIPADPRVIDYEDLLAKSVPVRSDSHGPRRKQRSNIVFHVWHHGRPERGPLQSSFGRITCAAAAHSGRLRYPRERCRDASGADVSCERVGAAVCRDAGGRGPRSTRARDAARAHHLPIAAPQSNILGCGRHRLALADSAAFRERSVGPSHDDLRGRST